MKNYEEGLVSETCPARLRRAVLHAMKCAFDPLNCHETEVLKLRMGLEDSTRRTIQEISSILGLSVSQIEEIEEVALDKAIKKPLYNLLSQAKVRTLRHQKLGDPEGLPDLEVAVKLLKKAYHLADLFCFASFTIKKD
jgi:pyruvate dehydrogenase complex dehydrogenase (E1) component